MRQSGGGGNVLVEPPNQAPVVVDAVRGPANVEEEMALTRIDHQTSRHPKGPKAREPSLALVDRTSLIGFAVQHEGGGADVAHLADGRHFQEPLKVVHRMRPVLIFDEEEAEVGATEHRCEVADETAGDRAEHDRRR